MSSTAAHTISPTASKAEVAESAPRGSDGMNKKELVDGESNVGSHERQPSDVKTQKKNLVHDQQQEGVLPHFQNVNIGPLGPPTNSKIITGIAKSLDYSSRKPTFTTLPPSFDNDGAGSFAAAVREQKTSSGTGEGTASVGGDSSRFHRSPTSRHPPTSILNSDANSKHHISKQEQQRNGGGGVHVVNDNIISHHINNKKNPHQHQEFPSLPPRPVVVLSSVSENEQAGCGENQKRTSDSPNGDEGHNHIVTMSTGEHGPLFLVGGLPPPSPDDNLSRNHLTNNNHNTHRLSTSGVGLFHPFAVQQQQSGSGVEILRTPTSKKSIEQRLMPNAKFVKNTASRSVAGSHAREEADGDDSEGRMSSLVLRGGGGSGGDDHGYHTYKYRHQHFSRNNSSSNSRLLHYDNTTTAAVSALEEKNTSSLVWPTVTAVHDSMPLGVSSLSPGIYQLAHNNTCGNGNNNNNNNNNNNVTQHANHPNSVSLFHQAPAIIASSSASVANKAGQTQLKATASFLGRSKIANTNASKTNEPVVGTGTLNVYPSVIGLNIEKFGETRDDGSYKYSDDERFRNRKNNEPEESQGLYSGRKDREEEGGGVEGESFSFSTCVRNLLRESDFGRCGGACCCLSSSSSSPPLPFPFCFLSTFRKIRADRDEDNYSNDVQRLRGGGEKGSSNGLRVLQQNHHSLATLSTALACLCGTLPLILFFCVSVWTNQESASEASELKKAAANLHVILPLIPPTIIELLDEMEANRFSRRNGVIIGGLLLIVASVVVTFISMTVLFSPLKKFSTALYYSIVCSHHSPQQTLREASRRLLASKSAPTYAELFIIKEAVGNSLSKLEKAKKFLPENALAQLFPEEADEDDDFDDDDHDGVMDGENDDHDDDDDDDDSEGDLMRGSVNPSVRSDEPSMAGRNEETFVSGRSYTNHHSGNTLHQHGGGDAAPQFIALGVAYDLNHHGGGANSDFGSSVAAFGSQLNSGSPAAALTGLARAGSSPRPSKGGGAFSGALLGRTLTQYSRNGTPFSVSRASPPQHARGGTNAVASLLSTQVVTEDEDAGGNNKSNKQTNASTKQAVRRVSSSTDNNTITSYNDSHATDNNNDNNNNRKKGSSKGGKPPLRAAGPAAVPSNAKKRVSPRRSAGSLADLMTASLSNIELLESRDVSIVAFNLRDFHFSTHHADQGSLESNYGKLVEAFQSIAKEQRGTLDSFHGDHFYFTFNAVRKCHSHSTMAATMALKLVQHMSAQSSHHSAIGSRVSCGVATGDCLVGNLGSDRSKRYSVIGTAYTQATVLERLCKRYQNTSVLLSAETALDCETYISFLYLDMIDTPGGRNQPVAAAKFIKTVSAADEWMYELQEQDEKSDYLYGNKAFRALLKGDVEAAKRYLSSFSSNKYVEAEGIKNRLWSFIEKGEITPLDLGLFYNECILYNWK